ncbi:MAG: hypothetical protein KC502_07945 [Myxococcales bacterium]|nr:hypothetical protein [Myxococcales bacterium]
MHAFKFRTPVLLAMAAVMLTPALALASGDAGFVFTIHGYYLIDFAVFLGILIYFGRKPIAAALDGRYKTIVQEIEEATVLHQQAQARYDEYKERLGRLEEELAQVIADVREGTEIECGRILEDARASADRIAADEAARIAQEGKKIREELAAHAVDVALKISTAQIEKQLGAPEQQVLVDRVIAQLGASATQEVQA